MLPELSSAARVNLNEARTTGVPAGPALRHVREVLEAHAGPVLANFTVDRLGYVVRADPMFQELAWLDARASRVLRESTLAALVPDLLAALAGRGSGRGRTVHDAWLGNHEVRVRFWLMPGASPAHTELSIYLQFA
ncbi:MAG: hypothetical protein JNK64_03735 [Myxococcales bacterium]|nr:hypothetical protein [Myxococcales bacterium]